MNPYSFYKKNKLQKQQSRKAGSLWIRLILPFIGFLALLWFLIRVIPKPSRATYPCQRIAFPLASSFIIWLMGIFGALSFIKKGRVYLTNNKGFAAKVCFAASILLLWICLATTDQKPVFAEDPIPNLPIGVAKGVYPGRVVWVHDPNATDWNGSENYWFDDTHTNPVEVEKMLSSGICSLAGENTESAAWDAIFRNFNQTHGKGDIGYQPGERFMIKINNTTSTTNSSTRVDPSTCEKNPSYLDEIDNSPQVLLALLRQLVYVVGVNQSDISIGDPTCYFPNHIYTPLHDEFPDVHYIAHFSNCGRTQAAFDTSAPMIWSTTDASGKRADYVPSCYSNADYLINAAILKTHGAGFTVCAKNHYGSMIRTPLGRLWLVDYTDYYNLHLSLPFDDPGLGKYRALVDMMGHEELGGKTLLCLVDGLFGGTNWNSVPVKWDMPPFDHDWPSSLFISMDQVAIDSVCYDLLRTEEPDDRVNNPSLQGGAEDYLHEAANAGAPYRTYDPEDDSVPMTSLGVHEHWNNSTDMQYSRNLDPVSGTGIELIKVTLPAVQPCDFNNDTSVDLVDFSSFSMSWQSELGDSQYNILCDVADPVYEIDFADLITFSESWMMHVTQP